MHLARAHQGLGDLEAALESQQAAVDIGRKEYGIENRYTLTAEMGLARVLLATGQLEAAYEHAVFALENIRKVAEADSPRVAAGLQMVGGIQKERGNLAEAERLMRQAVGIRRESLGGEHPLTAWSEVQLAEVLMERGRKDEAVILASAGLRVLERRFPAGHARVATAREVAGRRGR